MTVTAVVESSATFIQNPDSTWRLVVANVAEPEVTFAPELQKKAELSPKRTATDVPAQQRVSAFKSKQTIRKVR